MSVREPISTIDPPASRHPASRKLDYARPMSGPARVLLTFVVHGVLWSLLSAFLLFAGCAVGGGLGNNAIGIAVGGGMTLVPVVLWAGYTARRQMDPRRRSAALSGSLTGVAVGALLVGSCVALAIG